MSDGTTWSVRTGSWPFKPVEALRQPEWGRFVWMQEQHIRRLEKSLKLLADEEAWSIDMTSQGSAESGPWYFDPKMPDAPRQPWKIAQDALR